MLFLLFVDFFLRKGEFLLTIVCLYAIMQLQKGGVGMARENISKTLRELREGQRLTVKYVQEALMQRGVSVSIKTIYGWENGNRLPNADTFLILCAIYRSTDILRDFGYAKTTVTAFPQEHLEPVAAHNDHADREEEQRLMEEDLKDL